MENGTENGQTSPSRSKQLATALVAVGVAAVLSGSPTASAGSPPPGPPDLILTSEPTCIVGGPNDGSPAVVWTLIPAEVVPQSWQVSTGLGPWSPPELNFIGSDQARTSTDIGRIRDGGNLVLKGGTVRYSGGLGSVRFSGAANYPTTCGSVPTTTTATTTTTTTTTTATTTTTTPTTVAESTTTTVAPSPTPPPVNTEAPVTAEAPATPPPTDAPTTTLPTAPLPSQAPPSATLPETGSSSATAWLAAVSLVLGSVLVGLSRRRAA